MIQIKDIYAGKLDANDEIKEKGYEEFSNSYIRPSGIDIDRLLSTDYGTPYFIMGDKGTGKTALLHYLENHIHMTSDAACTSFICFDTGFSHVEKEQMRAISRAISSQIWIDSDVASFDKSIECDFTYVWRWQFYQKIIDDNISLHNALFEDDKCWKDFVKVVFKINKTVNERQMRIPAKIQFSATPNPQLGTITPGISIEPVDFTKSDFHNTKSYKEFVEIINKADELVLNVKRTKNPYYIFVDELEAYRGENDTFYRDLRMIRDLLFTVKKLNDIFQSGTKFICSVRLEILNSINRFIVPHQLHKIMQGFDERLLWEYTNTNSFNHPIIGVLLKRIEIAEKKNQNTQESQYDITRRWFIHRVYNTDVCTYILDNTWHKPRDIVRMLLSAQSKNSKNSTMFNQSTFDTFMPEYSRQCLIEIKEEMYALYTPEEVECIVGCLQGFKTIFSYDDIKQRAIKLYPKSIMTENLTQVLYDIYRVGLIGNYLNKNTSPRWTYKGQFKLYIDDNWKMIIHPALRIEMSVNGRKDKYITISENTNPENSSDPTKDDIYQVKVERILYRYILTSFEMDSKIQKGYISMGNLGEPNVQEGRINEVLKIGNILYAKIIRFDNFYHTWYMSVV